MELNVLHLCCNYTNSAIYRELFRAIHRPGVCQVAYVPLRRPEDVKINALECISIIYSPILEKRHRVFYKMKIRTLMKDVQSRVDLKDVDLVHAHTLFSDGGVAYLLKKKYGIRYLTVVRNTDLNAFLKWKPYLLPFACDILSDAGQVVFLSPAYRESLLKRLPEKIRNEINKKSLVIPSGVDFFWIQNLPRSGRIKQPDRFNLIQVGGLFKNKNVSASIKAVEALNRKGIAAGLTVVGEGPEKEKLLALSERLGITGKILFRGFIREKEILRNLYRESDILLMPSRRETFGLVCPEAMSQGLPVVYTRGQGFDGHFEAGCVGFPIVWNDVGGIVEAIRRIGRDYSRMSENCRREVRRFNWAEIADVYIRLYGVYSG